MENKKELVVKGQYDIDRPAQLAAMAKVLKAHIVQNKLYTEIQAKNYAHVEGWQFAGSMLGIFPRIESVENLSSPKELKWSSETHLIDRKTDKVISKGFAVCSNLENKRKNADEYVILSMAQTRSIGKAYRNVIGWVMKLAGYEATPAEDMMKVGEVPIQRAAPFVPQGETPRFCNGRAKTGCPDGAVLTKAEFDYSMKLYKKPLCRACQKNK